MGITTQNLSKKPVLPTRQRFDPRQSKVQPKPTPYYNVSKPKTVVPKLPQPMTPEEARKAVLQQNPSLGKPTPVSAPATKPPPAPAKPQVDPLTNNKLAFSSLSELLPGIRQGEVYGYVDGKWQKLPAMGTDLDKIEMGFSSKGNDLATGRKNLNSMYSDYLSAREEAKDIVKRDLNDQKANALLRGVDFQMPDEVQLRNLENEAFSNLYSPEKQKQLKDYMNEFGNPTDFKGFQIVVPSNKIDKKPLRNDVDVSNPMRLVSSSQRRPVRGLSNTITPLATGSPNSFVNDLLGGL
jgi:hypothetical protein